ncbi:hypothetical protein GEMRC1_006513 [Eukaryota sp. GEM-RC1]
MTDISLTGWILTGVLICVCSLLAASSGIGGGALYSSILVLVLHSSFNTAFGLSKALIFATMCAAFIADRRQPQSKNTLPLAFFLEGVF